MDFDEAVAAHSQWKRKLVAYIAKPDRSLKSSDVAMDDKCVLGQWLSGEGKKHSHLQEFPALVKEHTRFHKAAGDVIQRADSGQSVGEDVALGARSEFGLASSSVVLSLMALKKRV